jgi:multicomponent Na+:H+ antiporter subunit D
MNIQPGRDVQLLIALLVPLFGAVGVMVKGKNENLREGISCVSSLILFAIVLSLIPDILHHRTLKFPMFTLLPGVSITLRADAMSMIFAIVASSLWTIAVFYSMGYM